MADGRPRKIHEQMWKTTDMQDNPMENHWKTREKWGKDNPWKNGKNDEHAGQPNGKTRKIRES